GSQLFQVHRITSEDVTASLPDAGIVRGFEKRLGFLLDYISKNSIKMILIIFSYWVLWCSCFLTSYIIVSL
uniref:hypothetical protein n=1 Tax=Enterobacter hormaechei TaxID=158836 RepID=UPI001C3E9319